MRRLTASLAGMLAAGALVLTGCGTSAGTGHAGHTASPGAASTGAHNSADAMFARMMIPHHRQAVAMAKMAHGKAGPDVRRLATAIEGAQGPEIATMTGWLRSWGEPVPSGDAAMDHGSGMMSGADMTKLDGMSGAAFDHAFLTMMITHHQGAVTMARTERRAGAYPPAKALAASIITAQNREIAKMRGLL
ncbi:MAG TPA: DUF305 domain-containing protein [Streptosporangiaceae bacterium]|jgi:uncharacterized protein (DUF305 family)